MPFDFESYLLKLDPGRSYEIRRLTGGLINETVRAVKQPSLGAEEGTFPSHGSLVLKYAPPFVAALGECVPLSQARQFVEAAALELFTAPSGKLFPICSATSVMVPRLLYHDPHAQVLIMSDLDDLCNLTDCLAFAQSTISLDSPSAYALGSRLGKFFADLHSRQTFEKVFAKGIPRITVCDCDSRRFIYEATVLPVLTYLEDFHISDASELYRRVYSDFVRPDEPSERSFVLGDSWPGAILVGRLPGEDLVTGVIDWEFASEGRGITGDIAQLLAHIHLHLLAAPAKSSLHAAIKALIFSLTTSYRKQARKNGSDWTVDLGTKGPTPATRAMRSAFILHGREMIINSVEREWPCSCGLKKQRTACALRKAMVEEGAWYLRIARADDIDFVNQAVLTEIVQKERLLLGLFLKSIPT